MAYGKQVFGPNMPSIERTGESRFGFVPDAVTTRSVTDAALALTEKDSGSRFLLDKATGIAITLPAYPISGTHYDFEVITTIAGGTTTVTSGDADELFFGVVDMIDTDTTNTSTGYSPDLSNDRIMTLNGGTQGGLVQSIFSFEYRAKPYSRGLWLVQGILRHTGNVATPFS